MNCAVRSSAGERSRARANRASRLKSVSRRGMGVKRLRPFLCRGIRTSGAVGSQWLELGWRVRVAFSFFEMSQDFPVGGDDGDAGDEPAMLQVVVDEVLCQEPADVGAVGGAPPPAPKLADQNAHNQRPARERYRRRSEPPTNASVPNATIDDLRNKAKAK